MISFIETKPFRRLVQEYLSDDEYAKLQQALLTDPEAGRVIYFLRTRQGQIWMLTLYPKNVAENIPTHVLKQIKDEIDG